MTNNKKKDLRKALKVIGMIETLAVIKKRGDN